MNKVKYLINKYIYFIILIIVSIIIVLLFLFNIQYKNNKEVISDKILLSNNEIQKTEIKIDEEKIKVKVDIKGYVNNPGVYELEENERVIDAIEKAGGLKEKANTDYINLSKKLVDEMIIIIYSENEVEKFKEDEKEIIYIEYECVCPDNINDSCINEEDVVNTNGVENKLEQDDDLISINTATKEQLMTLSGIGESKALAIINYREENGEFKSLEDIMNVSGIGESAYSKIKDYIKL